MMPRASPGRNRAGRQEPKRPLRARGPRDEAGRWRSAPCPAGDATRPQDSRQVRLMRAQRQTRGVFTSGASRAVDDVL